MKNPIKKRGGLSVFILIVIGLVFINSQTPTAFASDDIVYVGVATGSSVPGCDETNQCYLPPSVSINAGDTVVWTNDDTAAHTVTSGIAADGPDGIFDSGLFMPGTTFSHTFDSEGTFPYFCMVHPWTTGEVIVNDSASSSTSSSTVPPPAPSGTDVTIPFGSADPSGGNYFLPKAIAVNEHDSVKWYNADSAAHTITSGTASGGPDGNFDSGLIMSGTTYSHTFNEAGNYDYFCMIHPWMTGKVVVIKETTTTPSIPKQTAPTVPSFADVTIPTGTSVPGCEETNSCYQPLVISTKVGNSITWFNQDSAAHTVTSGIAADGPDGIFDSSLFMPGTTFSHTFDSVGTFPYFCMVHPWTTGEVIVSGSSNRDQSTSNEYVPAAPPLSHDPSKIYSIHIAGTKYSVDYRTSTGKLTGAIANNEANSIIIQITTGREGQLTITLPRDLIDAKIGTRDDNFFVLVDGQEMDYNEIPNSVERKLIIPFNKGAEEIEIIGTMIVTNKPIVTQPTHNEDKSPFTASALPVFDVSIKTGTSVQGCEKTSTCYDPVWIFGKVGDKITWYNADSAAHTVTSGNPQDGPNGVIDSGLIMPGDTFTHTVSQAMDLTYFCQIHPWMRGQVIIEPETNYTNDSSITSMYDFREKLLDIPTYPSTILKFKVIFVNSVDEKCSDRNYEALQFYKEVSRNYLSWYGIENHPTTPVCITENDYGKLLDQVASEELQLLILMQDRTLSETHSECGEENPTSLGCFWVRNGVNSIVVNSDTWKTQGERQAMTISHEISHFVLYNKGEPESIWKYWVHDVQNQINNCAPSMDIPLYGIDYLNSISNCPPSLYRVMYADGKTVPVMRPYYEDKIQYDTRTVTQLNALPKTVSEGQKITISGSLSNVDGHPVGYAKISINEIDGIILGDTLVSTKTDAYGKFSVDWTATSSDFWNDDIEIIASFSSDGYFQGSSSSIQTMTVY